MQQWMCEQVLGITPATEHVETITVGGDGGEDQEQRELRLGAWIGNQRSRAATLTPERVERLSKVGMRWA